MFEIKKILVPTDFSEQAAKAIHPAHQLAARFGSRIDLVHIIPTLQYFNESIANLGVPFSMEKDLYPKIQKESLHKLNKLMDEHIKEEYRGDSAVRIAPRASKAIVEYGKKEQCDLIVMATHGKHESDFLRGSVTEKVIRYSDIPVLTTDDSSLETIEQIMVPTDGSERSLQALTMAVSLALTFDASIILYHVLELHGSLTENVEPDPRKTEIDNIHDILFKSMESFFEHSWDKVELRKGDDLNDQLVYSEGASNATIDINTVIEKGVSANYAIREYAEEHADLVVMTTHGHSGLAHLLLGSTTEKVTQHLKKPVLTVKPSLEEKK